MCNLDSLAKVNEIVLYRDNLSDMYHIMNTKGDILYYGEESNITQCCFAKLTNFHMDIFNNRQRIMLFSRPCGVVKPLEVSTPPGNIVGTVHQALQCCRQSFTVYDVTGQIVFRIEDLPYCSDSLHSDYTVMNNDRTEEVGKLVPGKRCFFSFPMDWHVHMKAVAVGACFLIYYMENMREMDEK